ncbi:hypothetical protein [Alloalcanivorax gelatiniphagus]|uniref:hypothetical protein n=1 Tax=Alloalcanivorax gelatiniphagus TaxID=1194167 RepID=UPI001476BCA0|nr:hypothetical protein [Alloalcanivorax gelatiniphagus]|tara:strand:- start:10602 stop:10772 length:171 start_codon:yes stop_codon:yes gene_type:complete
MRRRIATRGLLLMMTLFYMPGSGAASADPEGQGQASGAEVDTSGGSEARRPTAIRG